MTGIILIDKPKDFTSFDVIAKMRGILHMKKLGHSGTLDPMATGVLPVFAGNATKAISILPIKGKSYRAGFRLGITTDTYDITGTIVKESPVSVSDTELLSAMDSFRGEISQLPPMYSAIKVGGKKLYELARKGIEAERPRRQVKITRLELDCFDRQRGEGILTVSCSEGTYIRSIIHDMGELLGCGAAMTSLVRTSANGFPLEKCITLEKLEQLRDEDKLDTIITPVEELFTDYPKIVLNEKRSALYKNGVKQSLSQFPINDENDLYSVYYYNSIFAGIGKADRENGVLRVYKNLGGEGT